MHRFLCPLFSLTTLFAASAHAASTLSFGTPRILYPGETFSLPVFLSADVPFSQLDLYLVAPDAPAKSFSILSRTSTWNGPAANPLTFPNTDSLPTDYPLPTTGSSLDLGFAAQDISSNIPPAAYSVESLSLFASPSLAPGLYSIRSTTGFIGSQLIDALGNNTDLPAAPFSLTITKPGDANLDARIDLTDLSILLNHFGQASTAWTDGNFDHAPTIDLTDLSFVLNNFGTTLPTPSTLPPSIPSPEPACLPLLSLSIFALIPRRRARLSQVS
ncbi:MAG: hypothetical protein ACTHN5_05555 [Phycisphaerae bacterium]